MKFRWWFLLLPIFVIPTVVVLLIASPWGQQWLTGQIQQQLSRHFQTQVACRLWTRSSWNHFSCDDFSAEIRQVTMSADILISHIDIDVEISLWHRWLNLETIELDHPKIQMHLRTMNSPPPEAPQPEGPKRSPQELLKALPLSIRLGRLVVEQLHLDIDQLGGGDHTEIHLRDLNIHAQGSAQAGMIQSQGNFSLAPASELISTVSASPSRKLMTHMEGNGRWSAQVTAKEGGWNFNIEPAHLEFDLNDFDLLQASPVLTEKATHVSFPSLKASLTATVKDRLHASVRLVTHQLMVTGSLRRPADLEWMSDVDTGLDLVDVNAHSHLQLAKMDLMEMTVNAQRSEHSRSLTGQISTHIPSELIQWIPALQALRQKPPLVMEAKLSAQIDDAQNAKGHWSVHIPKLDIAASHGSLSLDSEGDGTWTNQGKVAQMNTQWNFDHRQFGKWQLGSNTSVRLESGMMSEGQTSIVQIAQGSEPLPVILSDALRFKHELRKSARGAIEATLEGSLPDVRTADGTDIGHTAFKFSLHSKEESGRNIELSAHMTPSQIHLGGASGPELGVLDGLNIDIQGTLRDKRWLSLPHMKIQLNKTLVALSAEASGDLTTQDLQAEGDLDLQIPQGFPPLNGQIFSGGVRLPIHLTLYQGHEVTFKSDLQVANFSWAKGALSIQHLNGHLPVSEKLTWDGHHVHFTDLIVENPFERVDFNRVRPLLHGNEQLTVDQLHWADKTYGPFVGFFSVRQNMISIHQFDMDLGGGRVYGELFFNVHPANLQMGFLGRLTGLNLTEFLPKEFLHGQDADARNLSARAGVVVNLNRATIDGRMDITEIGGRQLSALLNVLDPTYEDDKFNKIRSLLQVGYPTGINTAFSEGYMDMDVDLKLLSIGARESVHGVPISNFINRAAQSMVQQTQQGILQ